MDDLKSFLPFLPPFIELAVGIVLIVKPLKVMSVLNDYYKKRTRFLPFHNEARYTTSSKSIIIARTLGISLIVLAINSIILGAFK